MKRFIYTLACLVLSIGAWAEGEVAKIGEKNYAKFAEAVTEVPTDGTVTTITMLADVDLTEVVTIALGKNVVLDLNNHNITSTVTAISNKGNLEVTGTGNITVIGTTKTAYGISNSGGAALTNRANLVVGENVTITAPFSAVYTSYGKTTVKGTLANTQADTSSNIYSTLRQSNGSEVIVAATAKVTGKVNAIYGNYGTLEVNSTNVGKIYADGSATQGLKIKKTAAIESLNVVGLAEFSDVEEYYVAAKAISACTGTVKLISDVNGALSVSAGKTVTLDLNGHKVSAETYPIKVEGNLTITGEGTVQSTGMGSNTSVQAAAYVLKDGKLTIESGNYVAGYEGAEGNPAVYVRDNAVVEIKGGDFVGGSKFLLNKLDASRETSVIEVTGGTFHNNFNPADNTAEGEHTNFVAADYKVIDNGDGIYKVIPYDYVAQVGDVKYESLAEAITAAQNGETVTLLADVTDNITILAGKNITLDLGGYTLNGKQTANSPTIKNLGTLTVKNGNVRREGDGSASWYIVENEGTITMDEGLNVEGSANASLIRNNAASASMTFNDGTYTQTGAFIVVKNDLGNVEINGGTFSTAESKNVLNNWDQMTINGGTFTGNIFNGAYDTDNNKLTINNGTFNTSQIRTYLGNGKTLCPIEIKGGTFTNAQMKYVGTGNNESDTDVQVAVSGGTFANVVPEKYCAEGFSPVTTPDSNGMYTVETTKVAMIGDARYASLVEAVAAATDGATIKLIRDGLKYEYVEPNRVITLDLNGFTYDCNIDNYGTLTIVDNSEEGTGKLVNSKKHWIVWNNPTGKLTVQSGTIAFETRENAKSDTGQQTVVNEGSLIVNGGTIDGYTADYNTGIADSYTDTYAVENVDGDVTINGGKLMGLHSLATFGGTSAVINGGQFIVPFGPGTNAVYNNTDELTVYINGGTFIGDTDYLINKNDNSSGSFSITGGKFYKYDPQHSKSENPIANFVPKEYAAQKDADGYYVIVPAIAYIDEMGYAVLDIAIEEAKETGDATTITLLSDAETEKETLPTNVTINANGKVLTMPSFVVLDGEAFTLPKITGAETYKVKNATYIRTNISDTQWGTVCLPFSLANGNGADYYTYNNINGSTLTVDETTLAVDPNTPVVFKKAKGGDLKINQTNAIVSLKEPLSLAAGALVGTYIDANIPANGSIYFINGDLFHQAQVSVKVPMYRAYIVKSSGAKPRTISIVVSGSDDTTATGIKVVKTTKTVKTVNSNTTPKTNKDTTTSTTEQPEIVEVYDATGRRIPATRKGLNLVKLSNGKVVKLFVK